MKKKGVMLAMMYETVNGKNDGEEMTVQCQIYSTCQNISNQLSIRTRPILTLAL